MDWKGSVKKLSWPNQHTVPELPWRGNERPQKFLSQSPVFLPKFEPNNYQTNALSTTAGTNFMAQLTFKPGKQCTQSRTPNHSRATGTSFMFQKHACNTFMRNCTQPVLSLSNSK
jgi:hypothetical protein